MEETEIQKVEYKDVDYEIGTSTEEERLKHVLKPKKMIKEKSLGRIRIKESASKEKLSVEIPKSKSKGKYEIVNMENYEFIEDNPNKKEEHDYYFENDVLGSVEDGDLIDYSLKPASTTIYNTISTKATKEELKVQNQNKDNETLKIDEVNENNQEDNEMIINPIKGKNYRAVIKMPRMRSQPDLDNSREDNRISCYKRASKDEFKNSQTLFNMGTYTTKESFNDEMGVSIYSTKNKSNIPNITNIKTLNPNNVPQIQNKKRFKTPNKYFSYSNMQNNEGESTRSSEDDDVSRENRGGKIKFTHKQQKNEEIVHETTITRNCFIIDTSQYKEGDDFYYLKYQANLNKIIFIQRYWLIFYRKIIIPVVLIQRHVRGHIARVKARETTFLYNMLNYQIENLDRIVNKNYKYTFLINLYREKQLINKIDVISNFMQTEDVEIPLEEQTKEVQPNEIINSEIFEIIYERKEEDDSPQEKEVVELIKESNEESQIQFLGRTKQLPEIECKETNTSIIDEPEKESTKRLENREIQTEIFDDEEKDVKNVEVQVEGVETNEFEMQTELQTKRVETQTVEVKFEDVLNRIRIMIEKENLKLGININEILRKKLRLWWLVNEKSKKVEKHLALNDREICWRFINNMKQKAEIQRQIYKTLFRLNDVFDKNDLRQNLRLWKTKINKEVVYSVDSVSLFELLGVKRSPIIEKRALVENSYKKVDSFSVVSQKKKPINSISTENAFTYRLNKIQPTMRSIEQNTNISQTNYKVCPLNSCLYKDPCSCRPRQERRQEPTPIAVQEKNDAAQESEEEVINDEPAIVNTTRTKLFKKEDFFGELEEEKNRNLNIRVTLGRKPSNAAPVVEDPLDIIGKKKNTYLTNFFFPKKTPKETSRPKETPKEKIEEQEEKRNTEPAPRQTYAPKYNKGTYLSVFSKKDETPREKIQRPTYIPKNIEPKKDEKKDLGSFAKSSYNVKLAQNLLKKSVNKKETILLRDFHHVDVEKEVQYNSIHTFFK